MITLDKMKSFRRQLSHVPIVEKVMSLALNKEEVNSSHPVASIIKAITIVNYNVVVFTP